MQIILKNKDLVIFINALSRVSVKNMKVNRGRAKLLSKVLDKYDEYLKDENDILTEYIEVDESGNFIKEGNSFKLKDKSQFKEAQSFLDELKNEEVVIKGGEYSKCFIDFFEHLLEAEDDFTADEAVVVDNVLEQYEKSKEEKENGI